uniref:Uncharacterized protein n=1 Tax=Anguilla anguilla TaxID=7936 RepID=A0A0E9XZL7_ANGAN
MECFCVNMQIVSLFVFFVSLFFFCRKSHRHYFNSNKELWAGHRTG